MQPVNSRRSVPGISRLGRRRRDGGAAAAAAAAIGAGANYRGRIGQRAVAALSVRCAQQPLMLLSCMQRMRQCVTSSMQAMNAVQAWPRA